VYTNILVAFDGSEGAHAALAEAVELERAGAGTLTLVRCTGEFERAPETRGAEPADPEAEAAAISSLREVVSTLPGPKDARLRAVDGHPPSAILAVAEEIGADLIVTGSRGRAMMPQAVLGRVSSALVSNAPCDVLVVQPRST
jgi:nucleotide-binding universal stress UspA family protein